MSDRKCARALIKAAELDLRALRGMADKEVFSDEIAGFHAQQAAEKALKAWLAIHGQVFPLTQNLGVLLDVLQAREPDAEGFRALIALNPFAVQFRYEAMTENAEPLDRQSLAASVEALLRRVRQALGQPDQD